LLTNGTGRGNGILGATITLPPKHGDLLIAFCALFVHWTGLHVWNILAFILHQLWSSGKGLDAFHHQRQLILRNAFGDTNALFKSFQLAFLSRKKVKSPFRRSLPLVALAVVHILAFAAAGVFSSRIASINSEVLLRPFNCGEYFDPEALDNQTDWDQASAYSRVINGQQKEAVEYAKTCYLGSSISSSSLCSVPIAEKLSSISLDAPACPFSPEICALGPALKLDSGYIDSTFDLGLNAMPQDRVWFRTVTEWIPFSADNYTTGFLSIPDFLIPGDQYLLYSLGPLVENDGTIITNSTFMYSNYSGYESPEANSPEAYNLQYVVSRVGIPITLKR
jgi:hypothetical protein